MGEHLLPGRPPVPLLLRRSTRARRITLRISRLDGRVTLTLPKGVSEASALAFAREKEGWIRGHLSQRPGLETVTEGVLLPVEGVPRRVVAVPGRRVLLGAGEIGVPAGAEGPRLAAWLKTLARDRLAAASDGYAAALGRQYRRITLRDTRSRWGSCTSDGSLMYSWRLAMAPPEVLDYVAAHEVAHLAEMNHSPAFWALVERLYGRPYAAARGWLKTEGNALHRFQF
ncbi:M48 family metallopeptidase [Seohaeicola zhoushanensis]|uniref:Zinc metalloprotease n=1 Tax=Seohaeicola zhoushanensis TaxID=1569283 RepID=A0A8J3M473_9RHOB|nr:SprT family zinc-dependent metalloprotease [Seohaeicola zhoushanensis]GHF33826.1 zinc metalloprotease [Seohaeicola zhoushanensis]